MEKKGKKKNQSNELQVWKVIGIFALVFTAVQLAIAVLGVGINYLMRVINAGENLRVFIGSTFSRLGMIAAILFISLPVIRSTLNRPGLNAIFPRTKNWWKDLIVGFAFSTIAMLIIFLIELSLGWITIVDFALKNKPIDAWLRAIWVAILINAVAAIGEEVLYRGVLLEGVKQAWDEWGALFISAIIFGGSHILVAGASETNWLQFIPLLALPGIMLGWAYLRTGNLWLATGIHIFWNLMQDDILNLTGEHNGSSLFGLITKVSGPKWFVGTSYGIEVGAAGVICVILVSLGIWWWTNQYTTSNQKIIK